MGAADLEIRFVNEDELKSLEVGGGVKLHGIHGYVTGKVPLHQTFVYHVVSGPLVDSTEDAGQQKLFISLSEAELAMKLAQSNSQLLANQDLCSPLPGSGQLSPFLFSTTSHSQSKLYQKFLAMNLKYDLRHAAKHVNSSSRSPLYFVYSSECPSLHPLEKSLLEILAETIALRFHGSGDYVDLSDFQSTELNRIPESEAHILSVWVSYLTLIVNSRCEISLSRTFNVPERELGFEAFRALKRTAREKKMPMFQTALSHITQIRLGGKAYRPSSKSEISPHIKGISEFVDFVDKLRSNLEDYDTSARVVVKRIVRLLETEFLKAPSMKEQHSAIQAVQKRMFEMIKDICSAVAAPSPKTPNSGGTLAGREAFRIIQTMITKLNLLASLNSFSLESRSASTDGAHLHTPVLSMFLSPASVKKSGAEKKTPVPVKKVEIQPATEQTPKPAKQDYGWAKTPETPFINENSNAAFSHLSFDDDCSNSLSIHIPSDPPAVPYASTDQCHAEMKTPVTKTSFKDRIKKRKSTDDLLEGSSLAPLKESKIENTTKADSEPKNKAERKKPEPKSKVGKKSKVVSSKLSKLQSKGQQSVSSFFCK